MGGLGGLSGSQQHRGMGSKKRSLNSEAECNRNINLSLFPTKRDYEVCGALVPKC